MGEWKFEDIINKMNQINYVIRMKRFFLLNAYAIIALYQSRISFSGGRKKQ